jgi:hypothetical protein
MLITDEKKTCYGQFWWWTGEEKEEGRGGKGTVKILASLSYAHMFSACKNVRIELPCAHTGGIGQDNSARPGWQLRKSDNK